MKYILIIIVFSITYKTIRDYWRKRCPSGWYGYNYHNHNWHKDFISFAGRVKSCTLCGKVRNRR